MNSREWGRMAEDRDDSSRGHNGLNDVVPAPPGTRGKKKTKCSMISAKPPPALRVLQTVCVDLHISQDDAVEKLADLKQVGKWP